MTSLNTSLVLPVVLLACLYLNSQAFGTSGHSRSSSSHSSQVSAKHHHRAIRSESSASAAASKRAGQHHHHNALASLLRRRRSSNKYPWGPSPYVPDNKNTGFELDKSWPSIGKRTEDEAWIWMPAYGYVPMPTDDGTGDEREQAGDRIGNLLRYG